MSNEQLAFVAEALLALCDRCPDRPFYSEEAMRGKLKRAHIREPLYAHLIVGRKDDPLLREECADVIAMARLTRRQSEVLAMRLEGYTFEEIGRSGGHSKQGAQNIFVQGIKKLARAFRVYPYRGLSEVYRIEVRRGLGRSPFGKIPVPAT